MSVMRPNLQSCMARCFRLAYTNARRRRMATAMARAEKREGDISDAFASLQGGTEIPLEPRFAQLKKSLLAGREAAIVASWSRLLDRLKQTATVVQAQGTDLIPEISFDEIQRNVVPEQFKEAYAKSGVCVIRNVVGRDEALAYKQDILEYVRANPHTKAFPQNDPQVYELYWSPSQVRARSHPNMLHAQRFLMSFWNASPGAPISLRHPIAYADRLRVRQPGDSSFALGPHMDGGSLERWERRGYALAKTYDTILQGAWEHYDPWDADRRIGAVMDLYGGVGNCSALRLQQAWLSMSDIRGGQGHLMVNPMLRESTAYLLLRPFFRAKIGENNVAEKGFLSKDNWELEPETSALIHGASPGHGQSLHHQLHPHLRLHETMVHMPPVAPGDYVAWHCDTIHAVDAVHNGSSDSSVLYIPACPLTADNARYLEQQKTTFLAGRPSPDFGGGEGETRHVGRPGQHDLKSWGGPNGLRSMGLAPWDVNERDLTHGERTVMKEANDMLKL